MNALDLPKHSKYRRIEGAEPYYGPKIAIKHEELGADLVPTVSKAWLARNASAIRFHAERGMSRASLIRIYGKGAVYEILGAG